MASPSGQNHPSGKRDALAAEPDQPSKQPEAAPLEPDGISAFAARVLNQLSLAAWLPGAFFAAGLTILYLFRKQQALDIAGLMPSDTPALWALALLSIPILVLGTLITQAFGFEAIRLLEGYWHRRGPALWLARVLISMQLRRKRNLGKKRLALSKRAFDATWPDWVNRVSSKSVLTELRAVATEEPLPKGHKLNKRERKEVNGLAWDEYIKPWEQRRIEGLEKAEVEYPEDNRVLPTRLGNIIRATEDRLENTGGDIESFSLIRRDLLPLRVQVQHDQFRTRLDMYCTLVFVTLALAVATPLMLAWQVKPGWDLWVWVLTGALLFTAWVAYQATLSSARGYATILRRMDRA